MIAIIKTGGKQYTVKAGQILKVEKLNGKKGESVSLKNVLALSDSKEQKFGNPLIKDASVEAKILEHIRDKKIIVFKKRRRQNYRSTQGHRQHLTVLKIESIQHGKKKSLPDKSSSKIVKKETSEKKVVKKASSKNNTVKKVAKKKSVTKKTTKIK